MCSSFTIVDKGNIRTDRELVQQLICNAIPLSGTGLLLILNTSLDGYSLVAVSRISKRCKCLSHQLYFSRLNSFDILWNHSHNIVHRTNSSELHDRSSSSRDHHSRNIEMLWVRKKSEQVVVDHLAQGLTWLNWQYVRNGILRLASRKNITHHYHQVFRLVGE